MLSYLIACAESWPLLHSSSIVTLGQGFRGLLSLPSCLLVDPVELSALVLVDLLRLEPQGNLLLRTLDSIGAVADVAADVDGVVTTDGTWGGSEGVGGSQDHCGITC